MSIEQIIFNLLNKNAHTWVRYWQQKEMSGLTMPGEYIEIRTFFLSGIELSDFFAAGFKINKIQSQKIDADAYCDILLNKTGTEMSETKIILDACCGSRMFWFDKKNPLALFADIRDEEYILCDGRNLKVHPDIVSDFTDMPFLDKSFKLVVFDPPHLLKVGKNSWLAKKYGKLPEDWPRVIKKGIDECFRVLDDYGVLIFKWNEDQITVREVLSAINRQPLFGHTTGRHGKTMWMCFMKLPIN